MLQTYVLWLRGFPDQSLRTVTEAGDDAIALGHAMTLCIRLGVYVCPLLLLMGDLAMADHYLGLLKEQQKKTAFTMVETWTSGLSAALQTIRGELDHGVPALRAALVNRRSIFSAALRDRHFKAILAQALGQSGRVGEALTVTDEALREAEITDIRWFLAEQLRAKGDFLLLTSAPDAPEQAECCYLRSLETARQQGALAWELRTAMSLARLRKQQARSVEGMEQLQSVYNRFTEGFDTPDLVAARALLEDA
jgi:predicted ATPase